MARKQFVSSKKNAPSHVSSKEAALQGRANGGNPDGSDREGMSDDDSVDSPVSSVASSPVSSDVSDGEDDDIGNPAAGDAVAVQVMPSSVGRGKQLRFPTMISRGKESRLHYNGSDREGSDSEESYASVASGDEDDGHSSADEGVAMETTAVEKAPQSPVATEDEVQDYPIKAFRARKRHRPDSSYFSQMSTHVRDCLLSVRDVSSAADVFREDTHHEFRRKLSLGNVERVQWKQASPPPAAVVEKDSKRGKTESSSEAVKKEKRKKEHRSKEKRSEKESSKSSSKKSKSSSTSAAKEEKTGVSGLSRDSSQSSKKERVAESDRGNQKKERVRNEEKEAKKVSNPVPAEPPSAHSNGARDTKTSSALADTVCSKCKKGLTGDNSSTQNGTEGRSSSSTTTPKVATRSASVQTDEVRKETPAATTSPAAPPIPLGTFLIQPGELRDVTKLRERAGKLNDEARALKHEGNRRGTAEAGSAGQVAQARYYLRSGAKFFQHALVLADIKAAYRELGDNQHARSYGEYSIQTLAQTSSLIESTIRTFQSARRTELLALAFKMASVVHLTIYRLQHVKLFSLYSDLFTPGRSPDSRQNGTTPPIGGTSSDSQEAAVKTLLLKEMEHTLRGFDMWRRYESCNVQVLPRITNPAVTDLSAFLEDVESEISSRS
ncbi:hypothetical protein Poli38472_004562 [Pythium oligandrum]|uniref:Uncharacterized protein n=1 Tax=Pythium oligandrum TaxID=41045 RepID=A0A8K1CAN5_PYTOL|nr:hypothetical protein Poli38472_004562 [Pythium oligandrum]|eukprot:TMW59493.1 hypothetical protein Poli38472_004562 [Pythium oligandrum]